MAADGYTTIRLPTAVARELRAIAVAWEVAGLERPGLGVLVARLLDEAGDRLRPGAGIEGEG